VKIKILTPLLPGCATGLVLSALLAALFSTGCKKEDIKVYRVAKEPEPQAPAQSAGHGHETQEAPRAHPQWTVPADWEARPPSAMLLASFAITGKDGQSAIVSVTPLPTIAGRELDVVNMWRGQVQLAPAAKEEIARQTETVSIGNEQGSLYDMVAEKPTANGKSPVRLTVATLAQGDTSWFFKLMGDDALVHEQKPAFLQFLKSIDFSQSGQPATFAPAPHPVSTNSKQVPHENSDKPLWIVPAGWQEVPAGANLVAKFTIPGENGTKAELNITPLVGMGRDALMNINRWRKQLGLPPTTEVDLPKQTQSLDVQAGQAMLVDITGTDARSGLKTRLLGAIVPQGDQTWFYKLMGNEKVVEREHDAFTQFLKTVKYSNRL
jgi:hypothetical protein